MMTLLTEREIACFMIGFSDSVGCHLKTKYSQKHFGQIDFMLQSETIRDLESLGILVTNEFYSQVLAETEQLMKKIATRSRTCPGSDRIPSVHKPMTLPI